MLPLTLGPIAVSDQKEAKEAKTRSPVALHEQLLERSYSMLELCYREEVLPESVLPGLWEAALQNSEDTALATAIFDILRRLLEEVCARATLQRTLQFDAIRFPGLTSSNSGRSWRV